MRKYRLPLLLGLLLAGIITIRFLPAMLRTMPTRYAMRLPAPLQAMALPANTTPILPTAAAPRDATGLLGDAPLPATATPPPSPTPQTLAASYAALAPTTGAATPTLASVPTATMLPTATPWPVPSAARMVGFTHIFQEWNNCGPATLVMAMTHFGRVLSQRDTALVMRPDPEDRNVTPHEMADFVNSTQDGLHAVARINGDLGLLKRLLANNIPVIIEIGFDPPGEYQWLGWYGHYLLPVAYDEATAQFWVYDSWLGTSEVPQTNADSNGRILSETDLDAFWTQFNHSYIVLYETAQETLIQQLLGDALNDEAMWAASLARAQADAARSPDNAFYWFNLGSTYNALGRYAEAATAFDEARAIGLPWRMLWYQFGPYEAYYRVGRYDDVLLLTQTTLQDRPYFEESYYYLGLTQAALGDAASARENLQKAHALNPSFAPAEKALAELPADG